MKPVHRWAVGSEAVKLFRCGTTKGCAERGGRPDGLQFCRARPHAMAKSVPHGGPGEHSQVRALRGSIRELHSWTQSRPR